MITIEESRDLSRILSNDSWLSFPLEMTSEGIGQFKRETAIDSRNPIVYVHVESKTRRVLRIGYSSEGINYRWVRNTNGHIATLEWAMKLSDTYRGMAPRFPQYVLFFHRLIGLNTTVWTVSCAKDSARAVESTLVSEFEPVWEQFNSRCKSSGVRPGKNLSATVDDRTFADPLLPLLDGLDSCRPWPLESH